MNGVYSCATPHSIRRVERKYKTQEILAVTRLQARQAFFLAYRIRKTKATPFLFKIVFFFCILLCGLLKKAV